MGTHRLYRATWINIRIDIQINSETISSDLTGRLQILVNVVSNVLNQFWVPINLVQRS